MPLLSQPWADPMAASSRVVALAGQLPYGVAQSMVRAVFFLGPFSLGAIAWEVLAALPHHFHAISHEATQQHRRKDQTGLGVRFLALASQAAALTVLALYNAYIDGAPAIACAAWPKTIAGISALSVSFAVAVFVLQAVKMARLSPAVISLLGFLTVTQLAIALSGIAAWQGGLTPSGAACYLRISRWFGIAT